MLRKNICTFVHRRVVPGAGTTRCSAPSAGVPVSMLPPLFPAPGDPSLNTVCPKSSDPFHIVSYYIKWVTTSWTHSIIRKTQSST